MDDHEKLEPCPGSNLIAYNRPGLTKLARSISRSFDSSRTAAPGSNLSSPIGFSKIIDQFNRAFNEAIQR